MPNSDLPRRPLTALALGAALILPVVFFSYEPDDAYITFRYVQNWLTRGEIVWNPGERVEGYSHPLYLVLLAMGGGIGLDLRVTGKLIGLCCGIGTVLHSTSFARRRLRLARPEIPSIVIATSLCFALWEIACLETILFAWLALALCDAALTTRADRSILLGGAALAVSLTRPEGPILAFGILCWTFWARSPGEWWWKRYGWLPVFAIGLGAFFVWRHHYYGDWLPNPYYVKTSGGSDRWIRGLLYCGQFALTQSPVIILMLVSRLGMRRVFAGLGPAGRLLVIQVLLYSTFVAWAGGDWMPGFRFFAGLLPLLALLAGAISEPRLSVIIAHPGRRLRWGLALGCALLLRTGLELSVDPTLRGAAGLRRSTITEERVAEYLLATAPPGALIATTEAGIIPFETPHLRYLDLIGLTDRHLAHTSEGLLHEDEGDPDYVFGRAPDFLVSWGYRAREGIIAPAVTSVAVLMNDPRFRAYVRVAEFPYDESSGLFVYRRADSPTSGSGRPTR